MNYNPHTVFKISYWKDWKNLKDLKDLIDLKI